MTQQVSVLVTPPGASVRISGPLDPGTIDALGDLVSSEPTASGDPVVPLQVERVADRWSLRSGDHSVRSNLVSDDLIDEVVGVLNQWVLDSDSSRLHLHAACVELDQRGIVLAGRSGSGKTTVTAALLRRGAGYLTDESLALAPGSRAVTAYHKPLTVKAGGAESEWDIWLPRPSTTGRIALRASLLGSLVPHALVSVVVFLRYDPGSSTHVEAVSPADATVRLLADCLDGHRVGVGAVDVVAALVGSATCVEITYGSADDAAARIAALPSPPATSWLASVDIRSEPIAASGVVRVAVFENSAALLEHPSGKLAELSRAETEALCEPGSGGPGSRLGRLDGLGIRIPTEPGALRTRFDRSSQGAPPSGSGSFRERLAAVGQYLELLDCEGLAPVIGGPLLTELDAPVPAGPPGPVSAVVVVHPDDLSRARAIGDRLALNRAGEGQGPGRLDFEGLDIELAGDLGAASFGEPASRAALLAESVPVRLGEQWVRGLGPYHRFIHACIRNALATDRATADLWEVCLTAPRTAPAAVAAATRAGDTGLAVVFNHAVAAAARATGGLLPEVIAGSGRRWSHPIQRVRLRLLRTARWASRRTLAP